MTKVKAINSKSWKPLKLEGAILSSGVEGLIGIEELTDYELENNSKKSSKRTAQKNFAVSDDDDSSDTATPRKPKLSKFNDAKKKEGKVKKPQSTISEEKEVNSVQLNEDFNDNFSAEAWTALGVPRAIVKALREQKFSTPTAIQALTIPPAILGRRDILGAAETGSGKTLAFGIPILTGILNLKSKEAQQSSDKSKNPKKVTKCGATNSGWIVSNEAVDSEVDSENSSDENDADENFITSGVGCVRVIDNVDFSDLSVPTTPKKPLYALILTPTRELAIQIKNHLCRAAKYTDIKIATIVGGMAAVKQERILSKSPEIVIATPGRLWELVDQGNPHLSQLNTLKYLAIDETDRMLEKGHFQELHQIIERINFNEAAARQRQTFVFSATLTLVHDIPDYLQRKKKQSSKSKIFKLTPGQKLQKVIDMLKINNPKVVDVTKARGTAGTLTECRITCTMDHKDYYLYYFLKRHQGRTLIFCNSIGCVKRLATLFGILECNPLPLHASMQQRQRLKNLEKFQEDPDGLLIATDVAARGLDIPNVEHVIHYQVPRTSESYVHRSGRTARAQKEGITILIMEPSELQYYTKLCKTLGHTEDIPTFPVVDRLLIAVKERVNVAREIDKLELTCRRDNVQKGWLKKAVEDMDLVLDEDQIETTMESKEFADLRRQLKSKRQQLNKLLSKPLFPKGFSGKYLDINTDVQFLPEHQTAVEVMKKVITENPKPKLQKSGGITKKSHAIKRNA